MKNLSLFIFVCLVLIGCKKQTAIPTSTTSDVGSALTGVWNYIHTVNNIPNKCNWTFNNDGTMVINDEDDGFNGQTITYSYNKNTKKLTLANLVTYQLNWLSSTKFSIAVYNSDNTEFTKSNSNTVSSNFICSYDFLIDGKRYSWSGEYKSSSCRISAYRLNNGLQINLSNPNNLKYHDPYSPDYLDFFIYTSINKPGTDNSDSTLINPKTSILLNLSNFISYTSSENGYCKLNISQYDTINHILKGSIDGIVANNPQPNILIKKMISGEFTVYLK